MNHLISEIHRKLNGNETHVHSEHCLACKQTCTNCAFYFFENLLEQWEPFCLQNGEVERAMEFPGDEGCEWWKDRNTYKPGGHL